jgi:hypothetical protein
MATTTYTVILTSPSAADHARAGATQLQQNAVTAGIFGGFAAADVYHQTIAASHAEHLASLNNHRRTLADVADKAQHAQRAFVGMDQHNAAQLRAVRCSVT